MPFFGKLKFITPLVGTLSTMPVKKAILGLQNTVTSTNEKFLSQQGEITEMAPWVATTVAFKIHRYQPQVIGRYGNCRGVRYGDRERGGLIRGGVGLITAGITAREGQRGRPAVTAALGAGQASEEGRKKSDPVVG